MASLSTAVALRIHTHARLLRSPPGCRRSGGLLSRRAIVQAVKPTRVASHGRDCSSPGPHTYHECPPGSSRYRIVIPAAAVASST